MRGQPRRVVVYTTTWCGDCRRAKRYLDEHGIVYEEVDIERDPEAAERVVRWSGGYRTVPTFDIDGQIIVDWDRRAVARVLGLDEGASSRELSDREASPA